MTYPSLKGGIMKKLVLILICLVGSLIWSNTALSSECMIEGTPQKLGKCNKYPGDFFCFSDEQKTIKSTAYFNSATGTMYAIISENGEKFILKKYNGLSASKEGGEKITETHNLQGVLPVLEDLCK